MKPVFLADGKIYEDTGSLTEDGYFNEIKINLEENVYSPLTDHIISVACGNHPTNAGLETMLVVLCQNKKLFIRFGYSYERYHYKEEWFKIEHDIDFKKILCDGNTAIGLDINGDLWLYNSNNFFTLRMFSSIGSKINVPDFTKDKFISISKGVEFVDISITNYVIIAVAKDGSIWDSESNSYDRWKMTQVIDGSFTAVAGGSRHVICLDDDGDVWGSGFNTFGALGFEYGVNDFNVKVDQYTLILQNARVKEISAGGQHTVCLTEEGKIFASGLYINEPIPLTLVPNNQISLYYGRYYQLQPENEQIIFDHVVGLGFQTMAKDIDGNLWITRGTKTLVRIKVPSSANFIVSNLPNQPIPERRFGKTKSAKTRY